MIPLSCSFIFLFFLFFSFFLLMVNREYTQSHPAVHEVYLFINVSVWHINRPLFLRVSSSPAQKRSRSSPLLVRVTQNTAVHAADPLELRVPLGRILHQLNLSIFLYVSSFSRSTEARSFQLLAGSSRHTQRSSGKSFELCVPAGRMFHRINLSLALFVVLGDSAFLTLCFDVSFSRNARRGYSWRLPLLLLLA